MAGSASSAEPVVGLAESQTRWRTMIMAEEGFRYDVVWGVGAGPRLMGQGCPLIHKPCLQPCLAPRHPAAPGRACPRAWARQSTHPDLDTALDSLTVLPQLHNLPRWSISGLPRRAFWVQSLGGSPFSFSARDIAPATAATGSLPPDFSKSARC